MASFNDKDEDINRITVDELTKDINRITLTSSSSSSSSSEFTSDEKDAYQKTKVLLKTKHKLDDKMISRRELLLCVINCKLRPENAAEKYVTWLDQMKTFDIKSFSDVWDVIGIDGKFLGEHSSTKLMTAYAGCGRDMRERLLFIINIIIIYY
jgi:hypothetical protein